MKILKKLIFILACISLGISLFFIVDVYAKYVTSANGNANIAIARWNIKINQLSIKNNTDFSSVITPIFPGNDNIASDIIAPTAEGYFDISFDFSAADVSFIYNISISSNENSVVQDLVATGYSIDGGPVVEFNDSNRIISDTILYTDNIDTRNLRIYITWDDTSADATMDNAADTHATTVESRSRTFRC